MGSTFKIMAMGDSCSYAGAPAAESTVGSDAVSESDSRSTAPSGDGLGDTEEVDAGIMILLEIGARHLFSPF
jgi:hypothetical protein